MVSLSLEGVRADALATIRQDHRRVRELFRQFEQSEGAEARKGIADTALVELEVHARLEEEIFYPAVARETGEKDQVQKAQEEHHAAERLMQELMETPARDPGFAAKFKVLIEMVESHMQEEETRMLPRAAEAGVERLEQLGKRMAERRQEILREMETVRPSSGRTTTRRSATGAKSRTGAGSRKTQGRSRSSATSSQGPSGASKSGARNRGKARS